MRRRTFVVLAVLTAIIGTVAGGGWWTLMRTEVDVPLAQHVQIEIPSHATSTEIGRLLAERGIVANRTMFAVRLRMLGADGSLKSGSYDLVTGSEYDEVIRALQAGPLEAFVSVTIPEGWTIDQVARRVQEKTGISADEFSKLARTGAKEFDYRFLAANPTPSLEGYLFPKTYSVRVGSGAREVLDLMLRQFEKETDLIDPTVAGQRGLSTHDIVTVASMIERECRVAVDRPLVSSVIYNRLGRNMYLEIDATIQYVIGNKPRLLYRDLRVRSPYNTYLNKGLPPGPIASPGLASLQAAASPAHTGYLYYVLTHRDGRHSFATTKAQFERLKAGAKRGLK